MNFMCFIYSSSINLRVWECSFPLQFLSAGFAGMLQQLTLAELSRLITVGKL